MKKRTDWKKLRNKIPNKIQIKADLWYEVLWADGLPAGDHLLGESRPIERQIVLDKNQSNKEACHTYYHELLHVFADEYGAVLTESSVQKLEPSFYYIIKLIKEMNE
jgi:hypothetical protein